MQKAKGANATVTVCHSRTKNPRPHAAGRHPRRRHGVPEFVTARMVREGAVVIDVGVNRIPDATKKAAPASSATSPSPAWRRRPAPSPPCPAASAPMTIAMLMRNTVLAAKRAGK
jgi:methylenetetrahydrofolate dehydrogenase (NADP+)/methenyltetrahydrofolate cyclohydrolase